MLQKSWLSQVLSGRMKATRKMVHKHGKSTALSCNAGSRCSLSAIIWSLATWILLIHAYNTLTPSNSNKVDSQVQQYHLSMYRKHEDIEDRGFEVKQRGKKFISPAGKHRGRRHTPVDDFLDVTSQRRSLYFPEKNLAVNPLKTEDSRKYHFYPGREWCDTDSRSIQAHGRGIIYVEETQTFYWHGENKDGRSYRMNRKGTTRQWRSNSKTNMNYARIEPVKNSWGWSWLERWMAAKLWENRLMEQAQMDACEIQSLKNYDDAGENLRKSTKLKFTETILVFVLESKILSSKAAVLNC